MKLSEQFIITTTGKKLYPFCISESQIDIEDIATTLSFMPRFGGKLTRFYSVAEHSILVSELCPDQFRLTGLLHDAAEAYIMDMPTPIKTGLPDYQELEQEIYAVIARKFNIDFLLPKEVKDADEHALIFEAEQVAPYVSQCLPKARYHLTPAQNRVFFTPRPPEKVKEDFLDLFHFLTEQRKKNAN